MARKTCFVVSPLGDEGSPVRQNADDLFDLIILPALEKYGFDVIRADRIPRTSMITTDVIELVQTSDLCVIDLTGHNPNVFYECGRRHETGKPYIHLLRRGETRPFDVAGVRDIQYDLSTPRSVHDCILAIQAFIDELQKTGFDPKTSGVSLSSVVAAIERLERRVAQLSPPMTATTSVDSAGQAASYTDWLVNPVEGYTQALALGDLASAERNLARLEQLLGVGPSLLEKATILVPAGSALAVRIVERCLAAADMITIDLEAAKLGVGALVHYYGMLDLEVEAIPTVEPLVERIVRLRPGVSNEDRAFLLNQVGRLYSGAKNPAKSLEFQEEAARLVPDKPAYLYNLSINFEMLGLYQKALDAITQCIALPNAFDDDDHLAQAVDLLARTGNTARARELFGILKDKFPKRAQVLIVTTEHVRLCVAEET